MAEHLVDDLE